MRRTTPFQAAGLALRPLVAMFLGHRVTRDTAKILARPPLLQPGARVPLGGPAVRKPARPRARKTTKARATSWATAHLFRLTALAGQAVTLSSLRLSVNLPNDRNRGRRRSYLQSSVSRWQVGVRVGDVKSEAISRRRACQSQPTALSMATKSANWRKSESAQVLYAFIDYLVAF